MKDRKYAKGKVIENRYDQVAHDCHIRLGKRFEGKKKQRIKKQEKEKAKKERVRNNKGHTSYTQMLKS